MAGITAEFIFYHVTSEMNSSGKLEDMNEL